MQTKFSGQLVGNFLSLFLMNNFRLNIVREKEYKRYLRLIESDVFILFVEIVNLEKNMGSMKKKMGLK